MPDMNSDLCYDLLVGLICDFSFEKLPFDWEQLMEFLLPLYSIVFLYSLIFAVHSCIHDLIRFLLNIVEHLLAMKRN